MLIFKKEKEKKALDTNSALELKFASEYVETPKTENPRPKSFFFVSTPI